MLLLIILLAVIGLAYANGANDNFKGVATLLGSGTTTYRGALVWATVCTFLGSLTAVVLAGKLLKSFSGRGLVEDELAAEPLYVAAVALGAGTTVLLATRIGMPISTTHSLVGALVGAGWAAGSGLNLAKLSSDFVLPLLVSPVLAVLATGLCYPLFHAARRRMGVLEQTCFCVGAETVEVVAVPSPAAALQRLEQLTVRVGNEVTCRQAYAGRVLGVSASALLDRMHYLSAGAVSFARGLNDTPKIAALLLLVPFLPGVGHVGLVGIAIAVGGLISARRVGELMSHGITTMNHGQGFAANLITSAVVIGASRYGLPVSTTHVSCGALFGIGAATRHGRWKTIGTVVLAWITTIPAGAILGAAAYRALG